MFWDGGETDPLLNLNMPVCLFSSCFSFLFFKKTSVITFRNFHQVELNGGYWGMWRNRKGQSYPNLPELWGLHSALWYQYRNMLLILPVCTWFMTNIFSYWCVCVFLENNAKYFDRSLNNDIFRHKMHYHS